MIALNESHLHAADASAPPLRSFTWTGDPILDVCAVQADYGHLLLLTTQGTLHGIHLDHGTSVLLCKVDLPEITTGDHGVYFGTPRHRLHAAPDGGHAAIVVDNGRYGVVVQTRSGKVTMHLDGEDYRAYTVPFSACFLRHDNRDVLVHRTAWNRLDASDPATGALLTERQIAPEESKSDDYPEHYLDYFHGQLLLSPDGNHLFDDGWVWHPLSFPRTWSVGAWLGANPWESEDGPSLVHLTTREDWNTPACWINDRHIALWGLSRWDDEEFEETGHGTGVQIFDVTEEKQSSDRPWPMDLQVQRIFNLFSDGARLYVAADTGTTAWDLVSRAQVAGFPGFTAHLHDRTRRTLVAFGPDQLMELALS